MNKDEAVKKEKRTAFKMIRLYCSTKHKYNTKNFAGFCPQCFDLLKYTFQRTQSCPLYETFKPVCSMCKVHCYKKEKRERIKEVMRFSGPKMLLQSPCIAFEHVLRTVESARRLR